MASMLSDQDIKKQLELRKTTGKSDLFIDNAADECITPVGYDVRAGDTLFSSYKGKELKHFVDEHFSIPPGDTVFLSTYETFELSEKIGGLTVSRLDPQLHGLQMQALSVDPTYKGELWIILTNHGREPVKVEYKQQLMTVCLFWMASPSGGKGVREPLTADKRKSQLKMIERAAVRPARNRRIVDGLISALLIGSFLWPRSQQLIQTNTETLMLWLSMAAFYASIVRKPLFRQLGWPE